MLGASFRLYVCIIITNITLYNSRSSLHEEVNFRRKRRGLYNQFSCDEIVIFH